MTANRNPIPTLLALYSGLFAAPAPAASLQAVSNWGASGVPSYISMYIYVPDKPAANPPILVVSHYCGGSASGVFGQAQSGGLVSAADKYGFIMIFPQTTNSASSAKCWDVGSTESLTHDGGGDTQAVAQMVKYAVATYKANPDRVYATGDSSGGMMTEALLAVYPDIFKGGSAFAGVPAACWSLGWSKSSNWGGTCAGSGNPAVSTVNQTAQQWGDKVRAMFPGYSGHRPRVQLFHGDRDAIIAYTNLREGVKEWTNVLGLSTDPTSTETGLTLGTHQATRQRWKNSCGYVVLEAITSIGGDHGPSDALFNSSYVVPFLGLDNTDAVDPEVAQCGAGGAPATGGATSTGGTTSAGGSTGTGGAKTTNGGTSATGGVASGTGGLMSMGGTRATSGGAPSTGGSKATGTSSTIATGGTTSSGGAKASGGVSTTDTKASGGAQTTGGSMSVVAGSAATGGNSNTGGSNGNGGTGPISTATGGAGNATTSSTEAPQAGVSGTTASSPTDSGSCSCRVVGERTGNRGTLGVLLFAALAFGRRRGGGSRTEGAHRRPA